MEPNSSTKLLPQHHVQQDFCTTRPLYRQGRNLTAIKVYTINDESQHLVIYRVPKINLLNELKTLCMKYGEIKNTEVLRNYKTEIFTECYHIHYQRIQSARIAKRLLDNKSFYGEVLHVCYAPEFETLTETRQKLQQRQTDVISRLEPGPTLLDYATVQPNETLTQNRKRKFPALPITELRLRNEDTEQIWKGIPHDIDPRTQDSNVNIKKHYQIVPETFKGVEYGPHIPSSYSNYSNTQQTNEQPKTIRTTLLPTNIVKNYKYNCNKRIVFKNKHSNNNNT